MPKSGKSKRKEEAKEPPVDEVAGKRRRRDEDADVPADVPAGAGVPADERLACKLLDYDSVFFGIALERKVRADDEDKRSMEELAHAVANGDVESVRPFLRACFPTVDPVDLEPTVKCSMKIMGSNAVAEAAHVVDSVLVACLWVFKHVWIGVAPQRKKGSSMFDAKAPLNYINSKDAAGDAMVAMAPITIITKEPLAGFEEYIKSRCFFTTEEPIPGARGPDGKPLTETKTVVLMAPMITDDWDPLDPAKLEAMAPATLMQDPYLQSPALVLTMRMNPLAEPVKDGTLDRRGRVIEYSEYAARKWGDINTPMEGVPTVFSKEEFNPELNPVAAATMTFLRRRFLCQLASCMMDQEGCRRICQEPQNLAHMATMKAEAKAAHGWRNPGMWYPAVDCALKAGFNTPIDEPFNGTSKSRVRTRKGLDVRVAACESDKPLAGHDTMGLKVTFPLSGKRDIEPQARPGDDRPIGKPLIKRNKNGKWVFDKAAYVEEYKDAVRGATTDKARCKAYMNEAAGIVSRYCAHMNGEPGAQAPTKWTERVVPVPQPMSTFLMNGRAITQARQTLMAGALVAVRVKETFHRKGMGVRYPKAYLWADAGEGYEGIVPRMAGAGTNDMGADDEEADAVFAAMMARNKAEAERHAAANGAGVAGVGDPHVSDEDADAPPGAAFAATSAPETNGAPVPKVAPAVDVGLDDDLIDDE